MLALLTATSSQLTLPFSPATNSQQGFVVHSVALSGQSITLSIVPGATVQRRYRPGSWVIKSTITYTEFWHGTEFPVLVTPLVQIYAYNKLQLIPHWLYIFVGHIGVNPYSKQNPQEYM